MNKYFGLALFLAASTSSVQVMADVSTEDRLADIEAQNIILNKKINDLQNQGEQKKANAFNPSMTVVGDIRGQYGIGTNKDDHDDHDHDDHDHDAHAHNSFENGVMVKEVEIELRGAVDPWADALVVLAIENVSAHKTNLHLEEAYARLKRLPGLSSTPFSLRAGIFKTAIGRMNRLHSHNYNQIDIPLAMRSFLGDEGYSSQGLSLNFSVGTSEKSALTLFVEGITNSKLPMQKEGAEETPSGVAHAWWHVEMATSHFLDLGASALIGKGGDTSFDAFLLLGGDVHYSYLPAGYGENPMFLFGNEFYSANKANPGTRWPMGNFTWGQVNIFGSSFLGLRYDLAPQEKILTKMQHAAGVFFTHYTTEFLRFRLGYEHQMPELNSFAGDHRMTVSMMFVLGSHPVEPYFANR